jgi:hypothetical protein
MTSGNHKVASQRSSIFKFKDNVHNDLLSDSINLLSS